MVKVRDMAWVGVDLVRDMVGCFTIRGELGFFTLNCYSSKPTVHRSVNSVFSVQVDLGEA